MSEIFKNSLTFRLFKKEPSFMDGVSAMVDMTPNSFRYNASSTEEEADRTSLQADWTAIGSDLKVATDKYVEELTAR